MTTWVLLIRHLERVKGDAIPPDIPDPNQPPASAFKFKWFHGYSGRMIKPHQKIRNSMQISGDIMSNVPERSDALDILKGLKKRTDHLHSILSSEEATPSQKDLAAGMAFEIDGASAQAASFYGRACALDDQNVEASARLALALLKLGKVKEGLVHAVRLAAYAPEFTFSSLVKHKPLSSQTVLGEALFLNGRFDEAETAFQAALKQSDQDGLAYSRLTLINIQTRRGDEALRLLESSPATLNGRKTLESLARLAVNQPDLLPVVIESGVMVNTAENTPVVN